MIRKFDLLFNPENNHLIRTHLNDPLIQHTSLKVRCSETGFTSLISSFRRLQEKSERPERRIERYLLFHGQNKEVDRILSDATTRLIAAHDFETEQGTVIVLDYRIRKVVNP
jgi:hypothetical protein